MSSEIEDYIKNKNLQLPEGVSYAYGGGVAYPYDEAMEVATEKLLKEIAEHNTRTLEAMMATIRDNK